MPSTHRQRRVANDSFTSLSIRFLSLLLAVVAEISEKCGMYMAESSIPNAGLGMYVGVDRRKGEPVSPSGEIAVPINDWDHPLAPPSHWLFHEYYWDPQNTRTSYDAKQTETIIPGVGMLANSHTGLVNCKVGRCKKKEFYDRINPQAGASSSLYDFNFFFTQDVPAGMEVFDEYGDGWFAHREHLFGFIPLSSHFRRADDILKHFGEVSKNEGEAIADDLWELVRQLGSYGDDDSERLVNALPQNVSLVQEALQMGGSARFSVPHVQRSQEWLQEHGSCIDNIKVVEGGLYGRGAFATRSISKGTVIAPAPLIQVRRETMHIYGDRQKNLDFARLDQVPVGQQLVKNYCYGHPESSILLYPYSPAVNAINHSPDAPNAKVQWSTKHMKFTGAIDWLNRTVEDVLENEARAGLVMEFVATREIKKGDEIFIDYGSDWQKAWERHVKEWVPPNGAEKYVPAHLLNEEGVEVRTESEQELEPYPKNVELNCFVANKILENGKISHGVDGDEYAWLDRPSVDARPLEDNDGNAHPCDVLDRYSDKVEGTMYRVRIHPREKKFYLNDEEVTTPFIVREIPRRALEFMDVPYSANHHLREAFRHEIHLPDEMVPKLWRDRKQEYDTPLIPVHETCGLYMAESAIPNSGLGIYTNVPLKEGADIFYPNPVIHVEDFAENQKFRRHLNGILDKTKPTWLLDSYYWEPSPLVGYFEANSVQSIVPGLGMLANSHTGLVNADLRRPMLSGVKRSEDPGAGATTNYHKQRFVASHDIEAGMEIFVQYGDNWFLAREDVFGLIPLSEDFENADAMVDEFWELIEGQPHSEFAKDMWKTVWEGVRETNPRMDRALPKSLSDLKFVHDHGSARYSLPGVVKTPEWLEKNGLCLDHIQPGISTLPYAGRGAFATRTIMEGTVISPAPLVQLRREHMEIWNDKSYEGEQLLLNYCYGHPASSLLFFPYSPVTNYINHHFTDYNAELRWSNISSHRTDWYNMSVDNIINENHAGLVMEFVATREIQRGEEVLLNYGTEWEGKWKEHLGAWEPIEDDYIPAYAFNNDYYTPIRTMREQETDPYPENIMTICYLHPKLEDGKASQGEHGTTYRWKKGSRMLWNHHEAYACDIVERRGLYTAVADFEDDDGGVRQVAVSNIPRKAIEFVDRSYFSDQFLRTAFRHEVGLPDAMVPEAWRDLH